MNARGEVAIVPSWPAPARVRAYSTVRTGGTSRAGYASLNLGAHVGDDPMKVVENRRRIAQRLGLPAEPCWLEQVHGNDVLDLDRLQEGAPSRSAFGPAGGAAPSRVSLKRAGAARPLPAGHGPVDADGPPPIDDGCVDTGCPPRAGLGPADAAVTSRAGVVCVVLTADCVPVLLAERGARRVGAAHAGWRGLAQGVLPAAVGALGAPPEDVLAWLGPAIGPRSFEVGDEVRAAFAERGYAVERAFARNARGRWQADLYALATESLNRAGVSAVYGGEHCTFTEAERFFSHRREAPCGRMASLIWID